MDAEIWRPIPSCPDYEASSAGRIRSLKTGTPRILRLRLSQGYLHFCSSQHGVVRVVKVHQAVAEAFYGPRPEGLETRHWNGDSTDNRAKNLLYGTSSQNKLDQVRHGTHPKAARSHCSAGHSFDKTNVYLWRGARICRECRRRQARSYYYAQKAKVD